MSWCDREEDRDDNIEVYHMYRIDKLIQTKYKQQKI